MSRRSWGAAAAALTTLAVAAPAYADGKDHINGYRVKATGKNLEALALAGFDVTEGRRGSNVEVFGTTGQLKKLAAASGVKATLIKDRRGSTSAQRSARAARAGRKGRSRARIAGVPQGNDSAYAVWRRFDAVAGDGKEQYLELYDRLENRSTVKRVVLGKTHLGRDIVALKLTRNAKTTADNSRPAVLYNALQHAREWLAGETCRRTLIHFADGYGTDPAITKLVDTRELWFVCVANPDGYEYTFTAGNRLWRKNLADNDGDGIRGETGDGVDPNRNFATNWGLDDEGSSSDPTSETYRGPSPASEPETKAMNRLWSMVDFKFQKNDHTAAELLLWPQGFQQNTPTPDNPIFEALAGTDAESAIRDDEETFDPDISAELYITNGDTLDDAYHDHGILGYTPEGTESRIPGVTGFEFEDDETEVQEEFLRHRRFSLDLARSAADPKNPVSHLGNTVEDFYVDAFPLSYGDPQPVQVTAKRSLGRLTMRYQVNGGATKSAPTSEFKGGERYYRSTGVYYHRVRGTVTGTEPGDRVKVWFVSANGKSSSAPFTYTAAKETGARVLVLADENYTGPLPAQSPDGTHYAGYYGAALAANGVSHDVYDVDANNSTAPHPLGVLSHYDAVVWETGDDWYPRRPGQPGGSGVARFAVENQLAVRDYLNEGGKLFHSGKWASWASTVGLEFRNFGFPEPDEDASGRWCSFRVGESVDGCIPMNNDFLQYYLGAYIYVDGGNARDEGGNLLPVAGPGDAFGPTPFAFGPDGADNQDHSAAFAVTSTILDPQQFPRYADSKALADWQRPGAGPFDPKTGEYYLAAGAHNRAFKRLRRTVDLTGKSGGELAFQMSADLESHWDYAFVEAREVGTDNWTTLDDTGDHMTQDTGDSCTSGWIDQIHPQLGHYQKVNADGSCSATGTTGEWHAFSGNSGGWQAFEFDLSRFAGKQVELSISVATDWGALGLGTWLDDVQVTVDGATVSETSFESDTGGWSVGPPPPRTSNPENGWKRSTQEFDEGAVVGTTNTVYTGFGFEGLAGADRRAAFMQKVLEHLGVTG